MNKKPMGKFKTEAPKICWTDEFNCLRSRMYAFRCGDDSENKLQLFANPNRKFLNLRSMKIV